MILATRLCYSMMYCMYSNVFTLRRLGTNRTGYGCPTPYELSKKKKTRDASSPFEHYTQSGGKVVKIFSWVVGIIAIRTKTPHGI